ncbi:MAG TPA: site-specific integrase [Pyrinomonadaceae bacterium]|jgi:integrase
MAVWKRYNGKRIKGEGPKGKGTWIVEFRLRGRYIKQAIPEARTKEEAKQAQTKIKRDIFDDKYNRVAGNKDFTEFVDEVFVPWARVSKRSWQDDEERARPLKEFFAGKRLRDVTPMFIEQFKQQRLKTKTLHKRDRSPATVNRELQVLSKVFSMAYDNGLVETNPMRRVHKLREAPARERYLTDEEEKRLFAVLVGRRTHLRPIVVVALQTGMRQGEILGLKWEHVDFNQKAIYIAHTKSGRPRRIPMSKPLLVELEALKQDASSTEHVFSYARTGLKLTTFRHAWEGACKAAKIQGVRFHDLRHTFATRLRAKGVHEMDIMTLLGHTTLQMTSRYTHAMSQNLRTAVDSLNKQVLPFRQRRVAIGSAPRSRQVATGTDGA